MFELRNTALALAKCVELQNICSSDNSIPNCVELLEICIKIATFSHSFMEEFHWFSWARKV
jgi:hypothetical protein